MYSPQQIKNILKTYSDHENYQENLKSFLTSILTKLSNKYKTKIDGNFFSIQYLSSQKDNLVIHPIDKFGNYYKEYIFPANLLADATKLFNYLDSQISKT